MKKGLHAQKFQWIKWQKNFMVMIAVAACLLTILGVGIQANASVQPVEPQLEPQPVVVDDVVPNENVVVNFDIAGEGNAEWDCETMTVPSTATYGTFWDTSKMAQGGVNFYVDGELYDVVYITPQAGPNDETWIVNILPIAGEVSEDLTFTANIEKRYPLWIDYQDFYNPQKKIAPRYSDMLREGDPYSVRTPFVYDEQRDIQWIIHDPSWLILAGNMIEDGQWYQTGFHRYQAYEPSNWTLGRYLAEDEGSGSYSWDVCSKLESQPNSTMSFAGDTDTALFAGELRIDQNSTGASNIFTVHAPEGYYAQSVCVTARTIYQDDVYKITVDNGSQFMEKNVRDYMYQDYTFDLGKNWDGDFKILFSGFDTEFKTAGIFNVGVSWVPKAPQDKVNIYGTAFYRGNDPAVGSTVYYITQGETNMILNAVVQDNGNYVITDVPKNSTGDVFLEPALRLCVWDHIAGVEVAENDVYNVALNAQQNDVGFAEMTYEKSEGHGGYSITHSVDGLQVKNYTVIDQEHHSYDYIYATYQVEENGNLKIHWESDVDDNQPLSSYDKVITPESKEGYDFHSWVCNGEELEVGEIYYIIQTEEEPDVRLRFTPNYQKEENTVIINWTILDVNTAMPVVGAYVQFMIPGQESPSGYTDEDGFASIEVPRNTEGTWSISHEGYRTKIDGPHVYDEPVAHLLPLIPVYALTINYVDQQGLPIADCYIQEYAENEEYSVTSPTIEGYQLVDPNQAVITGTMPAEAVNVDVVYDVVSPTPPQPGPTPTPGGGESVDTAQTGDNTGIIFIIIGVIAAACAAYVIYRIIKKKK